MAKNARGSHRLRRSSPVGVAVEYSSPRGSGFRHRFLGCFASSLRGIRGSGGGIPGGSSGLGRCVSTRFSSRICGFTGRLCGPAGRGARLLRGLTRGSRGFSRRFGGIGCLFGCVLAGACGERQREG